MKTRWLIAIIVANLSAVAALVFIYPHLMVAPGALIPAHTALATDCFACHAPFRGAAPDRCIACHKLPDIGLRTTTGKAIAHVPAKAAFHQQLMEQDCMACHSDHDAPKLTRGARKAFKHALLRADIRDRCESCHKPPADELHRALTAGCAQCHTATAWRPASFDHDKKFVLAGDHNAACATCHVNSDFSKYTCYGCHEHTPDKIRRKHQHEGIQNFENCVECHRSAEGESEGHGERGGRDRD